MLFLSQRPEGNTRVHTAVSVRSEDRGFIIAQGGKQGGQCFGKEMEKEWNSQQETPFPYDHLWKQEPTSSIKQRQ